jgi:hypothetical protein
MGHYSGTNILTSIHIDRYTSLTDENRLPVRRAFLVPGKVLSMWEQYPEYPGTTQSG